MAGGFLGGESQLGLCIPISLGLEGKLPLRSSRDWRGNTASVRVVGLPQHSKTKCFLFQFTCVIFFFSSFPSLLSSSFFYFVFFFLYWKIIALQYGAGFCDFLNRHGGAPGTRKICHSLIMYHLVLSIAILLMFSAAFGGPQKAGFWLIKRHFGAGRLCLPPSLSNSVPPPPAPHPLGVPAPPSTSWGSGFCG